jgi:hypothetical protein
MDGAETLTDGEDAARLVELIQEYLMMNETGRAQLMDYACELAILPKYRRNGRIPVCWGREGLAVSHYVYMADRDAYEQSRRGERFAPEADFKDWGDNERLS